MFDGPGLLRLAYAANVVILLPVVWSLFASGGTSGVFEGKVADSEGLRLLVASLYLAILLASLGGLAAPAVFAPVLLVQIVYKTVWLLSYVVLARQLQDIPVGISLTFLAIVLTYPVLLWFSEVWRSAAG